MAHPSSSVDPLPHRQREAGVEKRHVGIIETTASSQFGLIGYDQLTGLEFTRGEIRGLRRRGVVRPVRPGVLATVGTPNSREGEIMAAVVAAGKTAFASHETAAWLWGLPLPHAAALEVTVVLERWANLANVRVHRSGLLRESDVLDLKGIPVSSPERTIVDLSSRFTLTELGSMADEAVRRHITSLGRIERLAQRLGRAPGRSPRKIAAMIERRVPGVEARESTLEDFVFDSLRRYEVPQPEPQHVVWAGGQERRLDHAYPAERVMIDALGYEYHGMRGRFDDDARRRNDIRAAGWRIVEVTSAFNDWQTAAAVAEALGLALPDKRLPLLTFEEWKALR